MKKKSKDMHELSFSVDGGLTICLWWWNRL